jgi:hypothetical protein
MSPWLDAELSLFCGAANATPAKTATVGAILHAIQTGCYRQVIEHLRDMRVTQGEDAYQAAKARLAAVTFGGTFAPTRAKVNLLQHSGIVPGDVDHLADVQAVKWRLCGDPHTAYAFVSPSGDGLKLGVWVMPVPDDTAYKHAWQAVVDYYQARYGVAWDPSGKDVCRLCFMSWDPHLYVNTVSHLFPVPPQPVDTPRPLAMPSSRRIIPGDRREYYARQALDTATKLLDASTPGNRHFWRRKAAYLLGGYVAGGILSAAEARATLAAAVDHNTEHFERSMQTIDDCLEAGLQDPITLEALEQERYVWRAVHWRQRTQTGTGALRTLAVEGGVPWH